MTQNSLVRVDFSLRREVFFVVIGAIIGAITMVVPITFLYTGLGIPYYLTWIAFGHVIGVYSSSSIIAGVAIHMITAISIGIGVGVFLYKTGIINMLEQADVESENKELKRSLITFVVVGGGFSGVETVGELNDLIRESIRHYYHNLDVKDAKIILVNSGKRILTEVTEDLAEFALQKLRKDGVDVLLNTRLVGAELDKVNLSDGVTIPCNTLVWTGGISS